MKSILLSLSLLMLSSFASANLKSLNEQKFPLKLPALPYAADSLSSAIDKETMEIHHGRHHKAYVDNANKALPSEKRTVLEVLKSVSKSPDAVRNNVGGHWNHAFFWTVLTPNKNDNKMPERLQKEIETAFGSFDQFKAEFEKQGASRFGSGWVWLVRDANNKLQITTTANQDNPLMDVATVKGIPVLGLDVWEHAYYLKYQNMRADYLKNIWNVINWKKVDELDREAANLKDTLAKL